MNLKEAFRYQNFLDRLLNQTMATLSIQDNLLEVSKLHRRGKAIAGGEDETEVAEVPELVAPDAAISLALSIAGAKPSEIEQRIPQIAQALNIQDVLDKYPYQMSGGQQQRVAAARAMVTNPAIVLADEPTGALDSNSSRMLLTMLTELNERLSATILMVTHDAFSASYCNRILFIKDGQVFNELHRGMDTRKEFFTKILEVVSVLGGEQSEHM